MNKDIELDASLGYRQAGLNRYLVRCYQSLRFLKPTPIQYYSISTYTSRSCCIVAQSKSGTGKTLSYISIILTHILRSQPLAHTPNYLIVLPTRELALQVYQNFKEIVNAFTHIKAEDEEERGVRQRLKQVKLLMSIGGIPFEDDRKKYLQEGANVLIGTIGRVLEFADKKLLRIEDLRMVVLDEGDKLFQSKNRKFADLLHQMMTLREGENFKVEFLLYSATLNNKLLQEITTKREFVFIQTLVDQEGTLQVTITEDRGQLSVGDALTEQRDSLINLQSIKKYKFVTAHENSSFFNAKMSALTQLLQELSYLRCLVFVEKKTLLEQINERLIAAKLEALLIHGSLSQSSRIKLMNQVNQSKIILASDLLARGIDIELDLVILFDARNNETFWHRIGRTGRYNKMGVAISLDDVEGWEAYDREKVQLNLNEIETSFDRSKEWYGKYLTELGTWNETTLEKEIEQGQEYRYFDEEKFNARKRRKEQSPVSQAHLNHPQQTHQADSCLQNLTQIKNQNDLQSFLKIFLNCSQCRSFMESIEQLTGYAFRIKEIALNASQ